MTSLDDLIRDTLAERARDVDGLELTAFADRPVPTHHRSRWIAVGTVVAVAAAILVAVVLVAPWRGAPDRNAAPPAVATPPAGRQWVSYHGITLTVPDSWDTTTFPCATGAGRSGLVTIAVPGAAIPCPPPVPLTPSDPVSVTLAVLGDQSPRGDRITVGGHVAYRADHSETVDPASPLSADVQLPDAGVQLGIVVPSGDATVVDGILADVEYTPVDHYGCTAQRSGVPQLAAANGQPTVPGPGPIVLCEYEPVGTGTGGNPTDPWLIGSRLLTADEAATVRAFVAWAEPGAVRRPRAANGPGDGIRVFLLPGADGAPTTLVADPSSGSVLVSDGTATAVVPDSTAADLPDAYATR